MGVTLLKRRLNPFLLAASVVALIFLAGLSVVYQDQLSGMLAAKQQLQSELEEKNETIQSLRKRAANLSAQLAATEDDLVRYIEQNNRLNDRIADLQDTISEKEQVITRKEERIAALNRTINDLNRTIGIINASRNAIRRDMNDYMHTICVEERSNNTLSEDSQAACDDWQDAYGDGS